jgi:hypothetical protein
MKNLVILFFLISLFTCKQKSSGIHYESLDDFTGGFCNFSLDLNSNGRLFLRIEAAETPDSGLTFFYPVKNVTGKWKTKNSSIDCTFDDTRSSIDSFFIKTDYKDQFFDSKIVTFSQKLDTAFIFGIPCVLVNSSRVISK